MQQIVPFDPTAAASGAFNLPLPSGGWLAIYNESVVGLQLTFGDGQFYIVPPFFVRVLRLTNRQDTCTWRQGYVITGAQAPTGLNVVNGECYGTAEWTAGEQFIALPRLVNVGNSSSGGTVDNLTNDGNPINTQIIESTAAGSPASNILITNDGAVQVKVLSAGVYTTVLSVIPGDATNAASVALHGAADSATALNLDGLTTKQITGHVAASNFSLLVMPQSAAVPMAFGVRVYDGANTHDTILANADGTTPFPRVSYFSGTGSGTFSHGLSVTPRWVGITSNEGNSTMTVGIDTITATTVHVNTGQNWPWLGIAIG